MKKIIVGLIVVSFIAIGVLAYAHGPGLWGGKHMIGQGDGGRMMELNVYGYDQKFLDETKELRKELHDKKFEYFEAARNPGTSVQVIAEIGKEVRELKQKIHEKAPRTVYGRTGMFNCR